MTSHRRLRRRNRSNNEPRQRRADVLPQLPPETPGGNPTLRFNPTAWAKLLFLRDLGDTEVGGFGISAADDLLLIDDVQLVRQVCTIASVAFDDQAVAEFFDQQVDVGRKPQQFGRVWVHTHPGDSPHPSGKDEETFARVFGQADWAVMFILARGGQAYCRLRFNVGPGGEMDLPVCIDYSRPFGGSDHAGWQEEYAANVSREEPLFLDERKTPIERDHEKDLFGPPRVDGDILDWWPDFFDELPLALEVQHSDHT